MNDANMKMKQNDKTVNEFKIRKQKMLNDVTEQHCRQSTKYETLVEHVYN